MVHKTKAMLVAGQLFVVARRLCCALIVSSVSAFADEVSFKRGYVDSSYGQTHYYIAQPADGGSDQTPLVLFHQTPTNGMDFKPLLLNMGKDRIVMAMDTPGFGLSDRPPSPATMSELALSMAYALENLGYGAEGVGQVDVFGFHTGVFIAAELSILRPDLVRKAVLSGIGYFKPEESEVFFEDLAKERKLAESGADILNMWYRFVVRRSDDTSFERGFEQFAAWVPSAGKTWYGFHSVMNYPIEERFALLQQEDVLILQMNEFLLENARRAKRELLPDADMIEMLDVSGRIFETDMEPFARHLRAWLD